MSTLGPEKVRKIAKKYFKLPVSRRRDFLVQLMETHSGCVVIRLMYECSQGIPQGTLPSFGQITRTEMIREILAFDFTTSTLVGVIADFGEIARVWQEDPPTVSESIAGRCSWDDPRYRRLWLSGPAAPPPSIEEAERLEQGSLFDDEAE
jgi:hypothetical protein